MNDESCHVSTIDERCYRTRPISERATLPMSPALAPIARCPRCRSTLSNTADRTPGRSLVCDNTSCDYARTGFPAVDGVPVLVDFERSILSKSTVMASSAASTKKRAPKTAARRLINRALRSEEITPANAALFLREAKRLARRPKILVIGGATVGTGAGAIYEDPEIDVIGSDIYRSDLTHMIADGHQLPIADQTVHGVWIQAVLEHVLEPHVVATEIHRVLAPEGIVYAETPFMQQVHEGAYDFTRFTLSGHRWLFRGFEEIAAGFLRGPGTVMLWSIRYLVAGLFGTWKAGTAAALAFFWLRFLDRLARPRFAADGPGGVFFLGRRSERELAPRDIISFYKGAQ